MSPSLSSPFSGNRFRFPLPISSGWFLNPFLLR
jgi:hypothetical protein